MRTISCSAHRSFTISSENVLEMRVSPRRAHQEDHEMFSQRAADASWEIFGPDAAPLTKVGLPVFDRDHNQVGKVAEVTRVAFRVDVPWDSDLWLGYDVIGTVLPGQYLELIITCSQ